MILQHPLEILFSPSDSLVLFGYFSLFANFNYIENLYIETLNFEGQAAIGSYVMIKNSNIRLLGSYVGR